MSGAAGSRDVGEFRRDYFNVPEPPRGAYNGPMPAESLPEHSRVLDFSSPRMGFLCALASATFYTVANVCLRYVNQVDPILVSASKALVTAVAMALLYAGAASNGPRRWLSGSATWHMAIVAAITHLGGNVAFQFSLAAIGLALSVPLNFSAIILGGALLGRFWLGEGIGPRAAVAMVVLMAASAVLGIGAEHTKFVARWMTRVEPDTLHWLGVAAAVLSGTTYSLLSAVIRRHAARGEPLIPMLLVVSITGVVVLTPVSLWTAGWEGIRRLSADELWSMLGAGLMNTIAFLALSRALKLIPVVRVNVVNTSQVAMAAAAGVLVFGEPLTGWLIAGVLLTVAGLVLLQVHGLRRPVAGTPAATTLSADPVALDSEAVG